jgi:hypothetical protein
MQLAILNQFCMWLRRLLSAKPEDGEALDMSSPMLVSQRVTASRHGDGLVLLAIDSGEVFACNGTGGRIWSELVECRAPAAIAADLGREYHLPGELVLPRVAAFVGELLRLRLVSFGRKS